MQVEVNWRVFKRVCQECSNRRKHALENDDGWKSVISQIAAEARSKNAPVMDAVMGIACVKCQRTFHRNYVNTTCSGGVSFDVVLYAIPRRKAVHVTATIVARNTFMTGELGKCRAVYEAYSVSSHTADAVKGFNRARTDSYWSRKKEAATRAIYWYEAKRLDDLYSKKYKAKKAKKAKGPAKQSRRLPPQLTLHERLCAQLIKSSQVISGHVQVNAHKSHWKFPACRGQYMTSAVLGSPFACYGLMDSKDYVLQLALRTHLLGESCNQYVERIRVGGGKLVLSRSFVYVAFPKQYFKSSPSIDPSDFDRHKWVDEDGSVWFRIPILFRPQSYAEQGEPRWVNDHIVWEKANTTERRLMKAYYGDLIDTRDFWIAESAIEIGDTGHRASIMSNGLDQRWLEMRFPAKGNRMISVEVIPVSSGDKFDHESIKKTLIELSGVIHKMTTAKTASKARRLTLEDK